jgi:hypothetical protein
METGERRIRLLHHPGQAGVRQAPPRVGDRRHVVDDIAQRRGLDEQNLGHDR